MRVAIVADTVRAYVDATASAQQIAVAGQTVALLDRSVYVTAALRDQRGAGVPPLEAARDAALFRSATFTGRAPRDLPPAVAATTVPPRLDTPIPMGDGRALIARRPGVRAAERRLAADTARIGVATADLYPRIQLDGQVDTTSHGLSDVFGSGPLHWLLGPLTNWNFPDIAATRADRGRRGRCRCRRIARAVRRRRARRPGSGDRLRGGSLPGARRRLAAGSRDARGDGGRRRSLTA